MIKVKLYRNFDQLTPGIIEVDEETAAKIKEIKIGDILGEVDCDDEIVLEVDVGVEVDVDVDD